jgi:hypothetical protein
MNNFPSCFRRGPALHQAVQGQGVAQTSFWGVRIMRFRASDRLRGGRDLADSRNGSLATGQERGRGGGRRGGRGG